SRRDRDRAAPLPCPFAHAYQTIVTWRLQRRCRIESAPIVGYAQRHLILTVVELDGDAARLPVKDRVVHRFLSDEQQLLLDRRRAGVRRTFDGHVQLHRSAANGALRRFTERLRQIARGESRRAQIEDRPACLADITLDLTTHSEDAFLAGR